MRRIVKVLRSSHFDELVAKMWRLELENKELREKLELRNSLLRSYMREQIERGGRLVGK